MAPYCLSRGVAREHGPRDHHPPRLSRPRQPVSATTQSRARASGERSDLPNAGRVGSAAHPRKVGDHFRPKIVPSRSRRLEVEDRAAAPA